MKNNNKNHLMQEKCVKRLAWWVAVTGMDMIITTSATREF